MNGTASLKQKAYEAILNRILNGHHAPGDLLNRRGMAEELDMSAAPVHEAMLQLENDGLLEAIPRRGTRVRTVQQSDVYGHLVVREALECQAARMYCGKPVQDNLDELHERAERADITSADDTYRFQCEVAFHRALVALTDCAALLREYNRVMQLGLFFQINLMMPTSPKTPVNRHMELLQTLAEATSEQAENCIREHVRAGKPEGLQAKAR